MVAIGARAEWICSDHPLNYGYGSGSPLSKLVETGGKVLLLGSDFDNVTILHYAENCARLPDKRVIRRTDKALSGSTVIDVVIEEFDTSESVVSSMPANYFAQITQEFVNAGYPQTGIVGHARAVLFRARELVQFAIDKMEREFGTSPAPCSRRGPGKFRSFGPEEDSDDSSRWFGGYRSACANRPRPWYRTCRAWR